MALALQQARHLRRNGVEALVDDVIRVTAILSRHRTFRPARELIQKPFPYSNGWLEVPETPGLGIELNEKAFANKPLKKWRRELMQDRDGNIAFQ